MYRPDDWKNPHMSEDPYMGQVYPSTKSEIFEAGADAYEEGLKKEGKYIDASKYPSGVVLNEVPPIQKLTRKFKGYIVIIPEEEE